ncbi:MAG: ATP-binding protein [Bacteroidetes bacterium HGW-Bacteroidetes-1]|jgi:predicted HTH transcriptional regulator|nr:MAG: ATP-binding protein [Bacteroidetes bacterium HGW-Bacteroidetes-1]
MSEYIYRLIAQGEHQQLDFKFEISDSRKIARSLVAFANTDGGRLLVGVKDNGVIAGVRSEEEYYMIEAAAQLYCKPEIYFQTKEWDVEGKLVLEVIVPKSMKQKHKAHFKDEEYKIYVRVKDKNLLASTLLLQVWKRESSKVPVKVSFTTTEMMLLKHLSDHNRITENEFVTLAGIKKRKGEAILADFILLRIIKMNMNEKEVYFTLIDQNFLETVNLKKNGYFR